MHEQETLEIIYGINPVKEALRAAAAERPHGYAPL